MLFFIVLLIGLLLVGRYIVYGLMYKSFIRIIRKITSDEIHEDDSSLFFDIVKFIISFPLTIGTTAFVFTLAIKMGTH